MAPTTTGTKRKAVTRDASELSDVESEAGFGEGLLEGILSQSEDSENDSAEEESEDEQVEDLEELEAFDSDEIQSNESNTEEENATGTLTKVDGAEERLVPGYDEDKPNYTVTTDANGGERYVYEEIDPVYNSDDSDAPDTANTIGNIPLSFYDSIQTNEMPEDGYDPYPATVEYFTGIEEIMPLSSAPEPKRRFLPSKHEAKRIMKIVRAIREGRILPYRPPEEQENEEEEIHYDIWQDEVPRPDHVMNIPAPKAPPPGYDMSYNPPPEYLPSKAEKAEWEATDPEDREKEYLPTAYDSLRKVPGYEKFIKERFERSLDLYLAPRVRKNRLNIDPASLLPKLPRPEELKPFPTVCSTLFRGHEGRVRSLAIDPSGIWLASGGDDGTVRVWELLTGRQIWSAKIGDDEAVNVVRWRPGKDAVILSASSGEDIYLLVPLIVDPEIESVSRQLLDAGFGYATNAVQTLTANGARKEPVAKWTRPGSRLEDEGVLIKITVRTTVKGISWHRRGDFFSTVSPTAQKSAVAIHTLSKHLTQIPFRRLPGIPQAVQFHPSRPLFFVATQRTIRSYDLQKQELVKIIQPGARWISSFDIHPGGDNLIVGSYDRRLLWHDLDLSTRPYKTMRFHSKAIRAVKYHKGGFPLFADASDDGSLQIFHGKVVSDMMENATIVPVKVLKGHKVKSALGVMDIDWHPREPWCVSAGADGTCRLWM
ncbi:ribosome biogenesis protein erb1 [Diplocarpon rosae]|nr:ribosome biogenesis protein erb1 [Diplocarpon rosae]